MIEIIPYQPRWPSEFAELAARIRSAVGDRVVGLHHIGSTSVPGLCAKDVIDIQLTVADLSVPLRELENAGFTATDISADHCPPGLELAAGELAKRYFRGEGRRSHLHVRRAGAFNQRYPILFRDFLRANAGAREAYGEIKRQLARYFPEDVEAYYDVKDPACDLIFAGAAEWAKASGWVLRSD
jgi:GrpB-like predicted nucleotidyltransferase (UPF0157 family)